MILKKKKKNYWNLYIYIYIYVFQWIFIKLHHKINVCDFSQSECEGNPVWLSYFGQKITIMVSKHDLMRLLKFINCAFLGPNNIVHTKRQRIGTSNIQYALYNLLNIFSTIFLQKFSIVSSITLSAIGNLGAVWIARLCLASGVFFFFF